MGVFSRENFLYDTDDPPRRSEEERNKNRAPAESFQQSFFFRNEQF